MTLQNEPWVEDTLPIFSDFDHSHLKKWIEPYIDEETSEKLSGIPHGKSYLQWYEALQLETVDL